MSSIGNQVCVGGGQRSYSDLVSTPNAVQTILSAFGYTYNVNDPLAYVYPLIIAQNNNIAGKYGKGFTPAIMEACLRTRSMLFCNDSPGDCLYKNLSVGTSKGTSIGVGLAAAGIGDLGAAFGIGGLGTVVSDIAAIFEGHSNAEAAQTNSLCGACPAATQVIQQIDQAVANRTATPQQGFQAMVSLQASFSKAISGIYKKGNAANSYDNIMTAQVSFSQYLYGLVALPAKVGGTVANPQITSEEPETASLLALENASAGIVPAVSPVVAAASVAVPNTSSILLLLVIIAAIIWSVSA